MSARHILVRDAHAASGLNDPVANSDHHSLGAGHCTKLSTKMLDMFLDCSAADVKCLANLPGRLAVGDQFQDFQFTRRQSCLVLRARAVKFEDSVKRIDRHKVQGWQLVRRQIERPTSEPYLTHP